MAVSHLGHLTRVAHDGASAIAAATEFAPDVIFLDIGLPDMNGYDVARALRALAQFSHVHIAAVTGWGQDEDRRKAREAGCDSHFTKPLAPAKLEELLGGFQRANRSTIAAATRRRVHASWRFRGRILMAGFQPTPDLREVSPTMTSRTSRGVHHRCREDGAAAGHARRADLEDSRRSAPITAGASPPRIRQISQDGLDARARACCIRRSIGSSSPATWSPR